MPRQGRHRIVDNDDYNDVDGTTKLYEGEKN